MKTALAVRGGGEFHEPPLELSLVLVYEDKPTALRAKHALDRVLHQPTVSATRSQFHLWKLDLLCAPDLKAHAARDAAAADIIIVSVHGQNRLTTEAEACLLEWIGLKRAKPCSLVISFDPEAKPLADNNPSVVELRSAAARRRMAVLLQFAEPAFPIKESAISGFQRSVNGPLEGFDQSSHWKDSYRDWGINE